MFKHVHPKNSFPDELKLADVLPIHKGKEKSVKGNYRPISILPSLSKVFEKIIFSRIIKFMESKLSILLCGFRSKHSTQHALFKLLQKWQSSLDKKGIVGTILMDLSKAFDSLSHDLLIAKLAAYGFDNPILSLLYDYLNNRFQRTKVGSIFSEWLLLIQGVPQGSILGPLLFNIFINDFFLFIDKSDVCNFADDNTLYSCDSSIEKVIDSLKHDIKKSLSWFRVNQLVANPDKFQLMYLGLNNESEHCLHIDGKIIEPQKKREIAGRVH